MEANATDGLELDARVVGEELAQLVDEDVEGTGGEIVILSVPETAEDGLATHHVVLVLCQQLQNLGLALGDGLREVRLIVAQGGVVGLDDSKAMITYAPDDEP